MSGQYQERKEYFKQYREKNKEGWRYGWRERVRRGGGVRRERG
jgi:hypothetical protein